MNPSNAELRQFILQAFSDEELVTLCFDYFREVYQDFSGGMTKNRKVLVLIDYCDNRGMRDDLYGALARERPKAWSDQFGDVEPSDKVVPKITFPSAQPNQRDPRQIFLSHATADADFAHRLAADLRLKGWAVWIAPNSILPGERWLEAINRGLEESGVFVVALTPNAVASTMVRDETYAALEMAGAGDMRLAMLEVVPCKLPALWRQRQYIPFRDNYRTGMDSLLGWLDGGAEIHPKPQFGMVGTLTTLHIKGSTDLNPDRRIHAKTGIELIRIPAGPFLYGSADSDELASDNEKPQQTIDIPEYWIGRAPVTNAQFARFVEATGNITTAEVEGKGRALNGKTWGWVNGADWRHPSGPGSSIRDKGDHPVVQVSCDDAEAFIKWAGLRLPNEQE